MSLDDAKAERGLESQRELFPHLFSELPVQPSLLTLVAAERGAIAGVSSKKTGLTSAEITRRTGID